MPGYSQFSGTVFSEFQLGNLPDVAPTDLNTTYNQANIGYNQFGFTGGIRFESFNASAKDRSYNHLSQRFLEYERGPLKARVGNFYTTLGRGLILRGFELPNVLFEQRQFRRRYAYYRDFDGVLIEGTWRKFEFSLMSGDALNNAFPPEMENFDSRFGNVKGGQIKVRPFFWLLLGDAYIKTEFKDRPEKEFNSFFSEISLNRIMRNWGLKRTTLKLYAEFARQNSQVDNFFSNTENDPHATYLSLNFGYKRLGLSAEYKDYLGFENLVNEPPIGYMEHGYYLLNRNSKELLSDYEKGYQFEATFRPTDYLFLLANTSFARNDLSYAQFDFAERFFEATAYVSSNITAKAFYDWAKEDIKSETDRKTGGVNFDWEFLPSYALSIDAQQQSITRSFGDIFREELNNSYFAATLSKSPKMSFALAVDRSTDPVETDDAETFDVVETAPKYWTHLVTSFQINMSHELSLFYGSRRGGLVCVSGTCFEVLPFNGLEFRWVGHF
jgi:hypothetical protein